MQKNTNLCEVIQSRDNDDLTLDQAVKELFSDKQVLARILKFTLDEFEAIDVETIRHCIEGTPEISSVPVNPGWTNNADKIIGLTKESFHAGEGVVFYDIRFVAITPRENIGIIINVEAQKSSDPKKLGYHIENRMVFYISRMMSAQKNEVFEHDNYDDIKKVKSIWLCMDSENDFIAKYPFYPENKYGTPDRKLQGGLIEGVIVGVRARKNVEESKNELIAMLEELLRNEPAGIKIEKLKNRHGLQMTHEFERGVNRMCNYSEMIKEEGIKESLYDLVQEGTITLEKAASKLQLSCEEVKSDMKKCGYYIPEFV